MSNEDNIKHACLPDRQVCPGCGTSEGHSWSKIYATEGVIIHQIQDVYITRCCSLEKYFLVDVKKVMADN